MPATRRVRDRLFSAGVCLAVLVLVFFLAPLLAAAPAWAQIGSERR